MRRDDCNSTAAEEERWLAPMSTPPFLSCMSTWAAQGKLLGTSYSRWFQISGTTDKCANLRLDAVQPPSAILKFKLTPTVISQLKFQQKSEKEYADENSFGKIHKHDTASLVFHILHWKSIVYHHLLLHAKLHLSRLHCNSSTLMQNCNLNCWQAFFLLLGFSLE